MNQDAISLIVPFSRSIAEAELPFQVIVYAACRESPEMSGGRHPEEVVRHALTMTQAERLAESLGPRFMLSANSTHPQVTDASCALLRVLEQTSSRLSVAHLGFAEAISAEFPRLHISASCIMSLYESWSTILNSRALSSICGPQYWNYNLATMVGAVPEKHRRRVHYIINSGCRHDRSTCRRHYENISERYTDPRRPPLACGLPNKAAVRQRARPMEQVMGTLWRRGSVAFKLEGRESAAPRWQPDDLKRLVEASADWRSSLRSCG